MTRTPPDKARSPRADWQSLPTVMAAVVCIALGAILAGAALDVEERPSQDTPAVMENIDAAEVRQPVTAVLLNFRGYDTWLEVGVLAVAVMSVLALHRRRGLHVRTNRPAEPVLPLVSRALFPFMFLVAGYLLWAGTHSPGGAFQAGAVLGAAGVLLHVSGSAPWLERLMSGHPLRVLAITGFLFFLGFGMSTLVAGRPFLAYPTDLASTLILAIETAVTVSIGWTLAFLYIGAFPPDQDSRSSESGV